MKKFVGFFVGAFVGTMIAQIILAAFGYTLSSKRHLCTCDYCKTVRQLETVEVFDSVIKERIFIITNDE